MFYIQGANVMDIGRALEVVAAVVKYHFTDRQLPKGGPTGRSRRHWSTRRGNTGLPILNDGRDRGSEGIDPVPPAGHPGRD